MDGQLTGRKYIEVDKDKTQLIILRYFRVLPEDQQGSYKYVHVYYRRDAIGGHRDGTSEIETEHGQLGLRYSAQSIALVPDYQPKGSAETCHYVHNNRPSCGTLTDDHSAPFIELMPTDAAVQKDDPHHNHCNPNSDATHITAAKEGNQIIILRYYREVNPVVTTGTYQIVHEYYFQEDAEDQGGTEDGSEDADSGTTTPEAKGGDPATGSAPSEAPETNEPASGQLPDILSPEEAGGIALQAEDSTSFSGTLSSGGSTPDPTPPPKAPETPPVKPETPPENPGRPTELPDPNDPNSPEEITIWENGVPKTYVKIWDPEKEEWVYVPDGEVPLWNKVPQTGDAPGAGLWMARLRCAVWPC